MTKDHYESIQNISTEDLVRQAIQLNHEHDLLSETEEDQNKKEHNETKYWDIVHTLRARGTDCELDITKQLVASTVVNERVLAANILGQLCWQEPDKYYEYAVTTLISLLDDNHPDVVGSAGFSLSHRTSSTKDYRAVAKLVTLAEHESPFVREGVVAGLCGLQDKRAISTLIKLMDDEEHYIRDWATFNIGSQIAVDTPEIRQALRAKLHDTDLDVRGEALVGLAERKDEGALVCVKKLLQDETEGTYGVKAAKLMAHPSLLPDLLAIKNAADDYNDYFLSELDEAIEACSGKNEFK